MSRKDEIKTTIEALCPELEFQVAQPIMMADRTIEWEVHLPGGIEAHEVGALASAFPTMSLQSEEQERGLHYLVMTWYE